MSLIILLILCNLATFVLALLTLFHTLRLRRLRSIQWLLVVTISFLIASFSAVLVYLAPGFEDKVMFFQFRGLSLVFFTAAWLYFISSVFDRWKWLHQKWVMAIVWAPCVLNFLMYLLPSTRALLFTDFQPFAYQGISVVQFEFGKAYPPFYLWSMTLMLLSYILSGITFVQERGYRRRQVLILNMGLGAGLLSFFFVSSHAFEWVMASSFSLVFTQVGMMYAVLRHRLLGLVPLASERIFQQLPDPVLVLDDQNRLMGANEKAINFFSLPKTYLGKPFEELLPTMSLTLGEVMIRDSHQRPHYFHLALEKIGGETDSSAGMVVFFRDIGQQKNVEHRLNEGLEFRARLLAFLAHDLTGFMESQAVLSQALQKNFSPEHHSQFELLADTALASQGLVNNVMSWVKSQTTQLQPDKRSFEWNFLLKEILEQMQSPMTVKGVEVVLNSTQKVLLAEGDSEMIAAVIRNLLSNSVRATPRGKRIYIDLDSNSGHAEVKVRDEGGGMDALELERIREASREFLLSGISKTHGSGIGLMIARYFISLHQGRFEMSSSLGSGTEVFFSIPLEIPSHHF